MCGRWGKDLSRRPRAKGGRTNESCLATLGWTMNKEWESKLRGLITGEILYQEPLSHHTSMGVGGKADIFICPKNVEELRVLIKFLQAEGVPFVPLGNGTNILFKDRGYKGVVIALKALQGKKIEILDEDRVLLCAEAGVSLQELVDLAREEGLTGMEFCAGIPGSVGGGAIMNAGAYGKEMKDCVTSVTIITESGVKSVLPKADLLFQYRRLELPAGAVIAEVCFLLKRGRREDIGQQIDRILALRKEKHPLDHKSAGSIFKNPPGMPAGQIIEELGLKGLRLGDAQISYRHANFIVNLGQAKTSDILILINLIKEFAWSRMGIKLEEEVRIIGED